MTTPIALTIAGSDSSGGAGIQADLKTFAALKTYGASIITALTAQNTLGVTAIHNVPAEFVSAQIDAVLVDLDVKAVKTGMLSNASIIEAVAKGIKKWGIPNYVLDPVMVSATGARLLDVLAIENIKTILMPLAMMITPNLHEAAALLETKPAQDENEMREQGEKLLSMGAQAVLIKGGHGEGKESVDFLITSQGHERLAAPRNTTQNTHGTGCTLAAAITAGLAKGLTMQDAVTQAKKYISGAIAHADELHIGQGHGPVHHFHEFYK